MNTTLKYIIVAAGVLLALLSMIYGVLLPVAKSRRFIAASQALPSARSVEDAIAIFDPVFAFYSPVGDEEVAKFANNNFFNFITHPQQSEPVARALLNYMEPKLHKNNARHLLSLGRMYYAMWKNHGARADAEKAEEYFFRAHQIGPRLPQPLFGLLEVYRDAGDEERLTLVADRILALWPDETRVQRRPTQ